MVFLKTDVYAAVNAIPGVITEWDSRADLGVVIAGFETQIAGNGIANSQVDIENVLGERRANLRCRLGLVIIVMLEIERQTGRDPRREVAFALHTGAKCLPGRIKDYVAFLNPIMSVPGDRGIFAQGVTNRPFKIRRGPFTHRFVIS